MASMPPISLRSATTSIVREATPRISPSTATSLQFSVLQFSATQTGKPLSTLDKWSQRCFPLILASGVGLFLFSFFSYCNEKGEEADRREAAQILQRGADYFSRPIPHEQALDVETARDGLLNSTAHQPPVLPPETLHP